MNNTAYLQRYILTVLFVLTTKAWAAAAPLNQLLQPNQNTSTGILDLEAAMLSGSSCTKPRTLDPSSALLPDQACIKYPIDSTYYLLIPHYITPTHPPQSSYLTALFSLQASLWSDPHASSSALVPASPVCSKPGCRWWVGDGVEIFTLMQQEVPTTYELATKQFQGVVAFMLEKGVSELWWTLQRGNGRGSGDDVTLGYIKQSIGELVGSGGEGGDTTGVV